MSNHTQNSRETTDHFADNYESRASEQTILPAKPQILALLTIENVVLHRLGVSMIGDLAITQYHLIFKSRNSQHWISFMLISSFERQINAQENSFMLRIRCRDFCFVALSFDSENVANRIFKLMRKLVYVENIEMLYAFQYFRETSTKTFGWNIFDPMAEFARQGIKFGTDLRISELNKNFSLCRTYPRLLVVPNAISDNVLKYAVKYRMKCRLPVLTYYFKATKACLVRSSQPMPGLKNARSPQDERLVQTFFEIPTFKQEIKKKNMIFDARKPANAQANRVALGGGSEETDFYGLVEKVYLHIENIHAVRDSLKKFLDLFKDDDVLSTEIDLDKINKSNWYKFQDKLLTNSWKIADTLHSGYHALVHCSDGWDRTASLCSLAEIMLDPFYRTIDGFIALVEKDWLAFGHKFKTRGGFLDRERVLTVSAYNAGQKAFAQNALLNVQRGLQHINKRSDEQSPCFHQFLECVYRLQRQYQQFFEYNERFLRRLLYHSYSCQYGTFFADCEKERLDQNLMQRTVSVWDYFLARKLEWLNPIYIESYDLLQPNLIAPKLWPELIGHPEMG